MLNMPVLTLPTYVVVTPARNEARFIELTIQSLLAQSVLPARWIVVSDGSTDATDDIVRAYSARHAWIELVRMPERKERHFAGKVHAFNAGYDRIRDLEYDAIACLDGDISFDAEYFAFLLRKLAEDPGLGMVGTPFEESGTQVYDYRFVNIEHVSGACQLFRRECFEAIGGYAPVKAGGVDYVAVISARMRGWKTRTFPEKQCLHHRKMGTAQQSAFGARLRLGMKDYSLGNHPLWQLFRAAYQMTRPPAVLGGLAIIFGYLLAWLGRAEKSVSHEMQAFIRQEQMQRLRRFLTGNRSVGKWPLRTGT
jgi:cellulose synthase/poly-beta-1,6-N-acetylglucosamine synthase-like glycosyltransferase